MLASACSESGVYSRSGCKLHPALRVPTKNSCISIVLTCTVIDINLQHIRGRCSLALMCSTVGSVTGTFHRTLSMYWIVEFAMILVASTENEIFRKATYIYFFTPIHPQRLQNYKYLSLTISQLPCRRVICRDIKVNIVMTPNIFN